MSTRNLKALRLSVSLLIVGGLSAALFHGGGAARAEVTLVKVEQSTVTESVKASGVVGAKRSWPVSSAAAGTISEILVTNGQQVNKGDVIVRVASDTTVKAAEQATTLYKNALAQKQLFDASMGSGTPLGGSGNTPLGVLAASLTDDFNALGTGASLITSQARQPALPSALASQLTSVGTPNVLAFLKLLEQRRGEIQGLAGDLATSAGSVQQLAQTLVTTLDLARSGDAQAMLPSIMQLATQASTGLGDMVKLAEGLQDMMDLLSLPPAAADEMPGDLVSSVLGLLGGQRDGMFAPLADLGVNLEKAQKSLVQVLGMTVAGIQSTLSSVSNVGVGGMSMALGAYVDATESMMRSANEKKAALEVRAPEAGLIALGSAVSSGSPAGSDPSSLLGGVLGGSGGGNSVSGAISTALGGLTGDGSASAPQALIAQGSDVGWGQKLFTVYDTGGWSARVTVDESKISKLAAGMPATVTVTSLGKQFPGSLTWISPVGNSSGGSVTFALEAGFNATPQEAADLRIGTKAEVNITLSQVGPAPTLRMGALTRDGNEVKVFVVRDGKTIERVVTVLASDGVNAAVEGLEAGDEVILAPIDIKNGQAVKAAE